MQIGLVVWLCTNYADSLSEAGAGFECLHCSYARMCKDGERDASGVGCASTHTWLVLHVQNGEIESWF